MTSLTGWTAAALSAAALVVSCGGKAIVDGPPGSGGAGGAGTTSKSSATSTGSTLLCVTTEPMGALTPCGGSGAVTSGGGPQCTTSLCDSANRVWESDCEGAGCRCRFNGKVVCTCSVQGGQVCAGAPSCCPAPFPK